MTTETPWSSSILTALSPIHIWIILLRCFCNMQYLPINFCSEIIFNILIKSKGKISPKLKPLFWIFIRHILHRELNDVYCFFFNWIGEFLYKLTQLHSQRVLYINGDIAWFWTIHCVKVYFFPFEAHFLEHFFYSVKIITFFVPANFSFSLFNTIAWKYWESIILETLSKWYSILENVDMRQNSHFE